MTKPLFGVISGGVHKYLALSLQPGAHTLFMKWQIGVQ